jgi:hypothetical protein
MPWLQEGCQDRLASSASMDGFVAQLALLFRGWAGCLSHPRANRASCATNPSMDALLANRSWPPSCSHGTYQHEAIISRSRQLLMMGTWLPETCWATSRREIKNTKVTSSWVFLSTLNYDARSTTHEIYIKPSCDIDSEPQTAVPSTDINGCNQFHFSEGAFTNPRTSIQCVLHVVQWYFTRCMQISWTQHHILRNLKLPKWLAVSSSLNQIRTVRTMEMCVSAS